jgi:hypothetical protein
MTKTKKSESKGSQATEEMLKLVEEIKELVLVRSALGYGTGTGVRKTAESTISRAISARVDDLSKLIVDDIDA